MTTATHRTSQRDGKVVIHDLELFCGFDPEIDDPKDERMSKYDAERIAEVVKRTQQYMAKGQNPKLILGHNPDDDDGTVRPAIGDIVSVQFQEIGGVPGIVGDVEVPQAVFDSSIGTNAFPRRSAEIWAEGFMSEVALLGSQTPARPLPDTKFDREGGRECFSRVLPVMKFEGIMSEAGPESVSPPRSKTMDDDMKAKMKAMEDENEQLKAKLKAMEDDEDEKDKEKNARKGKGQSVRMVEIERDDFRRQVETLESSNNDLRREWLSERYDRELDAMQQNGYRMSDRKELHKRILDAADPASDLDTAKASCDDALKFYKTLLPKDPHGLRIDQSKAVANLSGDDQEKYEREAAAATAARDRCTREGKHDATTFQAYFQEALAG